jgi:hypothetical protein
MAVAAVVVVAQLETLAPSAPRSLARNQAAITEP